MAQRNVDPADILNQLDRIVSSPIFRSSGRLCGFLEFVVREALEGRAENLKEFRIGVEVYERDPERYQPAADPIVRVEAARLRSKLREYYEGVNQDDPVRIEVPKGSYASLCCRSRARTQLSMSSSLPMGSPMS